MSAQISYPETTFQAGSSCFIMYHSVKISFIKQILKQKEVVTYGKTNKRNILLLCRAASRCDMKTEIVTDTEGKC